MTTEGWNYYINVLSSASGGDLVEGILGGNGDGVQWSQAWTLDKLAGLGAAGVKKIIDAHAKQSRASIVVPYGGKDIKFICTNSSEDFTFWSHSGELGGIAKPVLICARANTCSVIGLFKTRGNNVNNVATVVGQLKQQNC